MSVCWNTAWNIVNAQYYFLCLYPQTTCNILFFWCWLFVFYSNGMFPVSVCCVLFFSSQQAISDFFPCHEMSHYLILCYCCIVFHDWLYLNLFTKRFRLFLILCYLNSTRVCLWAIHEKWNSWFTKYDLKLSDGVLRYSAGWLYELQSPSNGLKNLLATLQKLLDLKCWPETNRLLVFFLHERWVYSESAENVNFGVCNHIESLQVPKEQEKEKAFKRGKASWVGVGGIVNKGSMAFHWLSPCRQRKGVLLSFGLCYHQRAWELPLLVSQLYFIEVSVYSCFTKFNLHIIKYTYPCKLTYICKQNYDFTLLCIELCTSNKIYWNLDPQ